MISRRSRQAGWRPAVLAAAILIATASLAPAQQGQRPPKPDRPETAQLVWSTLIAVDHANRTGNYSVLRDLGAPGFQQTNDSARLAQIFANLRDADLGLDKVILFPPEYLREPAIQENGLLRVTGVIPMRPEGILFDLLYEYVNGDWRLMGISVAAEEPRPVGENGNATPEPRPSGNQ